MTDSAERLQALIAAEDPSATIGGLIAEGMRAYFERRQEQIDVIEDWGRNWIRRYDALPDPFEAAERYGTDEAGIAALMILNDSDGAPPIAPELGLSTWPWPVNQEVLNAAADAAAADTGGALSQYVAANLARALSHVEDLETEWRDRVYQLGSRFAEALIKPIFPASDWRAKEGVPVATTDTVTTSALVAALDKELQRLEYNTATLTEIAEELGTTT